MKRLVRLITATLLPLMRVLGPKEAISVAWQLYVSRRDIVCYGYEDVKIHTNREAATAYHIINSNAKIKNLVESIEVQEPEVVLDVGANVGLFSLFVKRRFPDAFVYAFEPSPCLAELVRHNLAPFSNWQLIEKAVCGVDGETMSLYVNKDSEQTNSLLRESVPASSVARIEELRVATITLDAFTEREAIGVIDVVKIDVQGAEYGVVAGGRATLKRTSNLLVEVSFLGYENPAVHLAQLFGKLEESFDAREIVNPVHMGADLRYYRVGDDAAATGRRSE